MNVGDDGAKSVGETIREFKNLQQLNLNLW